MSKLSSAVINSRLSGRGIRMKGEFKTTKLKTDFECTLGHVWISTPNNVLSGKGCPVCGNVNRSHTMRFPEKTIDERLLNFGIKRIGDYINSRTKIEFECNDGHRWIATPNHIMRGVQCPTCSSTKRWLTKEIINERLGDRNLQLIGEYFGAREKSEFECDEGHRWEAQPQNVLGGTGCPTCAVINGSGFNPNKSAWEYIFTRDDYIKYGITNDLDRRLREHRMHGDLTLIHSKQHEFGQTALDWENNIKRVHGGKYTTKEKCPDGWTETLSLNKIEIILTS